MSDQIKLRRALLRKDNTKSVLYKRVSDFTHRKKVIIFYPDGVEALMDWKKFNKVYEDAACKLVKKEHL